MAEFNGKSSAKALSHGKSSAMGCGCFFMFFFGIFLMVGLIGSTAMMSDLLVPYLEVRGWAETPCVITKSEVDGIGNLVLEYQYTYRGLEVAGTGYTYDVAPARPADPVEFVREFPVGAETVCYVNPDDPTEAVLNREFRSTILFAFIPVPFALVGLVGMIAVPVLSRRMSRKIDQLDEKFELPVSAVRLAAVMGQGSKTEWRDTDTPAGPQELRPTQNSKLVFVACLFFSLFWCSIVSFLVMEVIDGWRDGDSPIFMTLFALPFVAVGLGGLCVSLYLFLKMFNPVPKLVVSERKIPLGDTIRIKWLIDGKVSSIRKLTVRLVGKEWIQYRQGTNTYTDTDDFYVHDIAVLEDPFAMEIGEADVTIPIGSMHTVRATNNQIRWELKILGDIRWWPDIDESFSITVLPQSSPPIASESR
ncbi:DUF3592 domain-containing protein [Rubinisphaera margarita]|uniref:DUF3592 domain-containing protein n=1 Tax=Rubinisphaera margarita TaxID=2909586 RepID=UPI001EE7CC75|nr:DUF3592 domain-containing protein [Rubinisphaera margarita]MCG6157894.1 DUF3592 domain-containing protein [Rubinisphaera margarita]